MTVTGFNPRNGAVHGTLGEDVKFKAKNGTVVIRGITSDETKAKTDKLLGGETPEGVNGSEFRLSYNFKTGEGSYLSESHGSVGGVWENLQTISNGKLSENNSISDQKINRLDYSS